MWYFVKNFYFSRFGNVSSVIFQSRQPHSQTPNLHYRYVMHNLHEHQAAFMLDPLSVTKKTIVCSAADVLVRI